VNYSITLAGKANLSAIPGIQIAAVSVFAEADIPLDIRYRVSAVDVLQEAQENGRLWVAIDDHDRVIGYAMLEILDDLAHLDDLDVHPDYARQGIGTALLNVAIDWAKKENYPAMTLVTFRHLMWNAPYYEKHGFSEIQREALTPCLHHIFADELAAGLNTENRIAMKLSFVD